MQIAIWDRHSSEELNALVRWLQELYPRTLFVDTSRQACIINEIIIPILTEGEGQIPENLDFSAKCRSLGLNPYDISSLVTDYMRRMNGAWDARSASNYLGLSESRVRHLAASGELKGEKVGKSGFWEFRLRDLQNFMRTRGHQIAA